jgi:hypothetical protein
LKSVLSVIFLLIISGCSSIHTQKGVDLNNKSSFVTISTETEKENRILSGLDKRVVITTLNGKSLFRMGWDFVYPDVVKVTSGIQTLEVRFNHMNNFADSCLWVETKLGENYIIKRKIHDYSVMFWVENIDTGERVGGICGSQPSNKNV